MHGKITISRLNSSRKGDWINITVADANNGVQFLDLKMSLEAFALTITSVADQPCTFELRGVANVGKILQHKEERIPYGRGYKKNGLVDLVQKSYALVPFEVDGWIARRSDLGNHHRGNDVDGYLVLFHRYVDGPEQDDAATL